MSRTTPRRLQPEVTATVPSADERAAPLAQVEALPVGTVVERHGVGIAQRFDGLRQVLPFGSVSESEDWAIPGVEAWR